MSGSDSRIPVGIRLEMLPGRGVLAQFENAARYGFDAVELPGMTLSSYRRELLAGKHDLPLPVAGIAHGYRGALLSADEGMRSQCRDDIKGLFDLCAELGARGVIAPPILHRDGQSRLVDTAAEDALLLDQLPELADCAQRAGATLWLEPVNRYETDYMRTIDQAAAICAKAGHPGLGIAADFFSHADGRTSTGGVAASCGAVDQARSRGGEHAGRAGSGKPGPSAGA